MTGSYPLDWPIGYPRTELPRRNPNFKQTSIDKTVQFLKRELHLMKATDAVLSTNIPLRSTDGLPYANFSRMNIPDRGVAVYFKYQEENVVLACDEWDRWEDNIYAIGKTVEALRGIDRWGVSEMLKRLFTGFKALPHFHVQAWYWDELGLDTRDKPTEQDVKAAFRKLAHIHHPDKGGNRQKFERVTDAYNIAIKDTSNQNIRST